MVVIEWAASAAGPFGDLSFCCFEIFRQMPVPELTSTADIKLNARVSLRPTETSLAWLQSRRLAAPSLACVLCDQGSLRALEAAPPPLQTKATRALRRMA